MLNRGMTVDRKYCLMFPLSLWVTRDSVLDLRIILNKMLAKNDEYGSHGSDRELLNNAYDRYCLALAT